MFDLAKQESFVQNHAFDVDQKHPSGMLDAVWSILSNPCMLSHRPVRTGCMFVQHAEMKAENGVGTNRAVL